MSNFKCEKCGTINIDCGKEGYKPSDIAELAKKSIRLTEENRRLEEALEEIEKILKDEICEECPGKEGCKAGCKEHQCLDIINKAKGKVNE